MLVILLLGLTAGEGFVGNKLLMLNFPMGEVWGRVAAGLEMGTFRDDEAWKLPFTSCSNDPRMDGFPSEILSFPSDLEPELSSLWVGRDVGSLVAARRKQGFPMHCCM